MPPLRADLHVHSTASDGTLAPSALAVLAKRAGLTHLAVTDHDSVAGIAEAARACRRLDIVLIPGVELSATAPDGGDVHVLGYFIDTESAELLEHLEDLRAARLRRAAVMVESLNRAGVPVTLDDVLRFADGGSVGRAHVARAIVSAGHAPTVADAFHRFIGRGEPHYVAKDARTANEVIQCVLRAGGIPVLAHPGVGDHMHLIGALVAPGLQGIEAFHPEHGPERTAQLERIADQSGLLVTGGSDFHGADGPNPPLGSVPLPARHLKALLAARA